MKAGLEGLFNFITNNLKADLKALFKFLTYGFAIMGVAATIYVAYLYVKQPAAFANPNSFLIVDVYKTSSFQGPKTRIFLEAPSAARDVHFEGPNLTYRVEGVPHWQSAVLLPGAVVAGKGTLRFGAAAIDVSDGEVSVDHQSLCPTEVTIGRDGTLRRGPIRIAR